MAVTKITRRFKKTKKKKTLFYAEVYNLGVRVAGKTFSTRAEAEVWHDNTRDKIFSGEDKSFFKKKDYTFSDCIEEYLKDFEGFQKLRESSKQSMGARMKHFTKSPLMRFQMKDISATHIDRWFDWILKQPTVLNKGRRSFKIELKYLATILNWYRNEKDPNFVVPIVRKHRRRAVYKTVAPRRRDYFIRPEDIHTWIDWLKVHRSNPLYHRLATFMILTGTRLGEACGLCWDQVDLEKEQIYICRTLSWNQSSRKPYLVDNVKSEQAFRSIHLPKALVLILKEISLQGKDGVVFKNLEGEMVRDNAVRSAFNAGFKALGLPWKATHICRHTWGTLGLKANGDNISKVQMNMGHSDRRVSEIYAKAHAQADSSTIIKTAELMGF